MYKREGFHLGYEYKLLQLSFFTLLISRCMKYLILLLSASVVFNSAYAQTGMGKSAKDSTDGSALAKQQDSIPYVTLHVYRSYISKLDGPLKKVPIFINDTLVHELKINTVMTLKFFREGKYTIGIDKKSENAVPFKVKFGKEYFFKCEVLGGLLNKRTLIYAVSPKLGKEQSGILTTE